MRNVHIGNLVISTAKDAEKYKHLEKITGSLYIYSNVKLDAPALTSVGGSLPIYSNVKLDAPALYPQGFADFRIIDGIPCVAVSTKHVNGIVVHLCREAKIVKQKIVGDKMYVAENGGVFAHGNTIAEAIAELKFKQGSRDISQYRGMPLDTVKTPTEWAMVYRMVTGACKLGVADFMQRKGKLKRKYTLSEILEETKGAYQSEAFAAAVK